MVEDVVNGCSTSTLISMSIGDGSGSRPQISSVALPQSSTTPIGYGRGCYFMTGCKGAKCYQ